MDLTGGPSSQNRQRPICQYGLMMNIDVANDALAAFHDAALGLIRLDWPSGVLAVEMSLSREPPAGATVLLHGTTRLTVPRSQPWGRSVSVNTAKVVSVTGAGVALSIEMQSGDVIEAEGERIDIVVDVGEERSGSNGS